MAVERKYSTTILRFALGILCGLHCSSTWAQAVSGLDVRQLAWQGEEGKLEVFNNSETFGSILAMNAGGDVLGMREVADEKIALRTQGYFVVNAKEMVDAPMLEGYTNVAFSNISNDGKAVGYASRGIGNPEGSLAAVVWDSAQGGISKLGHLPGNTASNAVDISADGKRIVGYSTGSSPAQTRPCVWNWNNAGDGWDVSPLPTLHVHNPYLVAGSIVISPDGNQIAGCATLEKLPNNMVRSVLFSWRQQDGSWVRSEMFKFAGRLTDINDAGQVAINLLTKKGLAPATIDQAGEVTELGLLEGDPAGQVLAIAADGRAYGFSDDPPGPDGGPTGVIFADDKAVQPAFGRHAYFSAVHAANASGQLAGLIDVMIKDGRPRLAGRDNQALEKDTQDQELTAKTLGFIWTPATKPAPNHN